MEKKKLSFFLNKIDSYELVLPDFQREYVWLEEGKVEGFIASVLSQIPLGSIITFNQDSNVFANKIIGFDTSHQFDAVSKVDYLLDGQQRITTLALVFSDRIFNAIDNDKNLLDKLLRKDMLRRYFLELPKYNDDDSSASVRDHFGYLQLEFPFDPEDITFCSDEIIGLIKYETFNYKPNTKKEWYFPKPFNKMLAREKTHYIESTVESGLIPLYLLADEKDILKNIIEDIAEKRSGHLSDICLLAGVDELKEIIKKYNLQVNVEIDSPDFTPEIIQALEDKASAWATNFNSYLNECMNLWFNIVKVENDRPDRAINIYEALNKGGAKLSTFDLIIAKAASENRGVSYFATIKDILFKYKNDALLRIISNNKVSDWNSREYMKVINSKDIISSNVINQFLNLLCIVSKFSDEDGNIKNDIMDLLSPAYCKEKMQLKLSSSEIWNHSEKCMKAICDALMIMQFKFGVISVGDIKYGLILLPIAYACYLMNNEVCSDAEKESHIKETLKKVIAWYWYSLFSGEYYSDQSTVVIKHIKWIHNWVNNNIIPDKFTPENRNVSLNAILNKEKYNDFNTLIFKEDTAPKESVKNSLIQYVLSLNPSDFIVDNNGQSKKLEAWDKTIVFEIHHMIPLGSATTIGQSTKEIRDKKYKELPINSPLNLAYISKTANDKIKAKSISEYTSFLPNTFLSNYSFTPQVKTFRYNNEDDNSKTALIQLLSDRFDNLKSKIIEYINSNLD